MRVELPEWCASCGSPRVAGVLWGVPSRKIETAVSKREVIGGGCEPFGDGLDATFHTASTAALTTANPTQPASPGRPFHGSLGARPGPGQAEHRMSEQGTTPPTREISHQDRSSLNRRGFVAWKIVSGPGTIDEKREALGKVAEQFPGDMGVTGYFENLDVQEDLQSWRRPYNSRQDFAEWGDREVPLRGVTRTSPTRTAPRADRDSGEPSGRLGTPAAGDGRDPLPDGPPRRAAETRAELWST